VTPRLLGSGAAVLLTLGLAVYGGNQVLRVAHLKRQLETMERDIVTLRARADELSRTVDKLRHDPAYMEKLVREEFGYVRPDETVFRFPSSGRAAPAK
jgi:cell division protein FtsB